jgi:tRNA-modifying protein YgfZ
MKPNFPGEYRALCEAAALVDRSKRGRIAAIGPDRLTYLHAMLTNDIAALGTGGGCYAAYLTPQGRMMADMRVLELGDLTLLDVEATAKAVVLEKLEQFIFSEDVRLADLEADLGVVALYGPRAADVVAAVLGQDGDGVSSEALGRLAEYGSARARFRGASAVVAADRDLGVPGFCVYVDRERAPAFAAAARDAGAVEAGEEAAETLRLEAGRPRFGADMDEHTIPLEAGIEGRAISLTKGCYPGQEVITRVLHRGHGRVAKKLVGLVVGDERAPAHGDRVVHGDNDVGTVTSAAISPRVGRPIALGYVQRDFVAAGTPLLIVHGDERLSATVADLPFVGR